MRHLALVSVGLVLAGGCRQLLGLDEPALGRDAAPDDAEPPDAPADVAPADVALDAALVCPSSYSITIAASSSRYRLIATTAAFSVQYPACNDVPGVTHLASLDSLAESMGLVAALPADAYWVGAAQAPQQPTPAAGWLTFNGGAVPSNLWDPSQPDDLDGIEDDSQNVAALESAGLRDRTASSLNAAICECDGVPIDAKVVTYLP